jgi:hypothetical protein
MFNDNRWCSLTDLVNARHRSCLLAAARVVEVRLVKLCCVMVPPLHTHRSAVLSSWGWWLSWYPLSGGGGAQLSAGSRWRAQSRTPPCPIDTWTLTAAAHARGPSHSPRRKSCYNPDRFGTLLYCFHSAGQEAVAVGAQSRVPPLLKAGAYFGGKP